MAGLEDRSNGCLHDINKFGFITHRDVEGIDMNESYQNWQPMETLPENGWVETSDFFGTSELFLLIHGKPYGLGSTEHCKYLLKCINEGGYVAWRSAGPMLLDVVHCLLQIKDKEKKEVLQIQSEEREKRLALEKANKELRAQIKELKSEKGRK